MADNIIAYADGSCIGNPGPGGWGVVIVEPDGGRRELSGKDPSTTNNRMELTAAIMALRAIEPGSSVVLRTDSQYLVKTMTLNWKRNLNLDLWRQLDAEAARRRVSFQWVRGHADDELNNRADQLARAQASGTTQDRAQNRSPDSASADRMPSRRRVSPEPEPPQDALARAAEQMLRPGEAIERCAGCGRLFIAADEDSKIRFCSLLECQLKARDGGAR